MSDTPQETEVAEEIAPQEQPRTFPEVRAAMALPDGRIDCEMEHPEYGWIPTTLDASEDSELFDHVVASADVADYAPPENWRDGYAEDIRSALETAVLELAGSPGAAEIASWPNKIEAARRIVSGVSEGEVILAPTALKFGLDMAGAAQVVLMRSRLYELAKVAAETTEVTALAELSEAKPEMAPTLLEGLAAQIEARKGEFAAIRTAATAGDLSLIEAAEQQLLGG